LIPLKDNIPTDRFPVLTVLFIVINIAVFAWQLSLPSDEASSRELARSGISERDQAAIELGAVPYRITHPGMECAMGSVPSGPRTQPEIVCEGTETYATAKELAAQGAPFAPIEAAAWWLTLLTSMFMHGGFLHLAGNMLFLWIFGNNVEDSMGRARFVLFYLLAGLTAVYSQAALDTSATVPTIGASGAIAGVLGAYALLYPRARVVTLVLIVFFFTVIEVPALLLLGVWFVLQALPAFGQVATPDIAGEGGVAYFAHVGGFVFGLAAIHLFTRRNRNLPNLKGTDPFRFG
jgi:membrane associated rhomboid family serine protease